MGWNRSQRWVILGLSTSTWVTTFPLVTFGLLLPDITQTFGLSQSQAGWLGSIATVGCLIIAIPAALTFRNTHPVLLTVFSTGGCALGAYLQGAAPSVHALFLARLGFSLALAIRPTAHALAIAHWFPAKDVPLVQSLISASIGAAHLGGLVLTPGVLEVTGSWRLTYFIFATLGIVGITPWLFAGSGRWRPGQTPFPMPDLPGKRGNSREVWLVGLATLSSGVGWWSFATFWPTFMLDRYGVTLQQSGLLLGLGALVVVPSSLLLSHMGTRLRLRRLLLASSGVCIAMTLVGSLLTANFWLLAVFSIASGLAWGYLPIAFSIPYEGAGINPPRAALGVSVVSVFLMFGGLAGPALAGAISELTGSLFLALFLTGLSPLIMVPTAKAMRDCSVR